MEDLIFKESKVVFSDELLVNIFNSPFFNLHIFYKIFPLNTRVSRKYAYNKFGDKYGKNKL